MKEKIQAIVAIAILVVLVGVGFYVSSLNKETTDRYPDEETKIELYGEFHSVKDLYDIEYRIWKDNYDKGERVLFYETPYYSAEFLNLWLRADNDDILNQYYQDLEGTQAHNKHFKKFLLKIKANCPETIFVGTDVGHQNETTGQRYLEYLEANGLTDSENYKLTKECMKQGDEYYELLSEDEMSPGADFLREEYMIYNFLEAYERVGKIKITGFYGNHHTDTQNESNMFAPIFKMYGTEVSSVNTVNLAIKDRNPLAMGFCTTGLVFLLMLFIPNFLWSRNQPRGYEKFAKNENKILLTMERIGEVLVTAILVMFKCFDPLIKNFRGYWFVNTRVYFWFLAIILMILYECFWIRYFKSRKTMQDFYSSFAGFPVAGASLPVFAVLILAIYGKNLILLAAGIILGIGHIGIHLGHKKEIMNIH